MPAELRLSLHLVTGLRVNGSWQAQKGASSVNGLVPEQPGNAPGGWPTLCVHLPEVLVAAGRGLLTEADVGRQCCTEGARNPGDEGYP